MKILNKNQIKDIIDKAYSTIYKLPKHGYQHLNERIENITKKDIILKIKELTGFNESIIKQYLY